MVFLVAAGIVTAIAMNIAGVGDDTIDLPGPGDDDVRFHFMKIMPSGMEFSSMALSATSLQLVCQGQVWYCRILDQKLMWLLILI